jgi:pimeloyl-ACP methyl ester carboxylesterase
LTLSSAGLAPAVAVASLERQAERQTTPSGAGDMLWRRWGEGSPLVLLHGAYGSWTHWLRNVPALAARHAVFAPDMPGYGASALPSAPVGLDSLVGTLAEGLERLFPAPARFALAGFSFGGIVAGHVAAALGDRVTHLVLIGPNGLGLPIPEVTGLRRLDDGLAETEVEAVHRHNLGRIMLAAPDRIDDLAVHLQMRNAAGARFKAGDIPRSDSLLRVLPAVRARLSGIWGACDALAGPYLEMREATLRRFQPDLDFRIVPRAGHWVPYEASAAVDVAMLEMLAREGATE